MWPCWPPRVRYMTRLPTTVSSDRCCPRWTGNRAQPLSRRAARPPSRASTTPPPKKRLTIARCGASSSASRPLRRPASWRPRSLISICPSIHPLIHQFIHLSICPTIHPSVRPSIHPSFHSSIHPSVHLSIHSSISPSIHPSVHPSVYPSICLSIHLSAHPSIRPSIHWFTQFPPGHSPTELRLSLFFPLVAGVAAHCLCSQF